MMLSNLLLVPVPISVQHLKALGFKKCDLFDPPPDKDPYCIEIPTTNSIAEKNYIIYEGGVITIMTLYQKDAVSSIIPRHIQYVHQIQEVYFALTGKEITV